MKMREVHITRKMVQKSKGGAGGRWMPHQHLKMFGKNRKGV